MKERIIVIYYKDEKGRMLISHGMKELSLEIVVMPNEPRGSAGERWDDELCEYVIS